MRNLLGNERWSLLGYRTDHARTMVLRFSDRANRARVVVVSPDAPDAFVALLAREPLRD